MSSSSKQPKKKRRIDDTQEPVPGPSKAVLPLVAPHLIRKSSKDPNKGLYPSTKGKSVLKNDLSAGFVKASELVKKATQREKTIESVLSSTEEEENKNSDFVLAKNVSRTTKPSCSKANCDTVGFRKKLNPSINNKKRSNISSRCSTMKITRYFRNTHGSKIESPKLETKKKKNFKLMSKQKDYCAGETSNWSENWKKKNEDIVESITENEKFFKRYQDCYGLIENSMLEENSENYFKNLPLPIIEMILCQIPILDLMNCRLVCNRWLDVIDNAKFMEWKKLYYRYKKYHSSPNFPYEEQIRKLLGPDFCGVEDCIGTIVKFMGSMFHRIPCSEMYSLLSQNSHGELADLVLTERFPEWKGKDSRVWCQLAIAVLICETVWDILDIYKCLFTSKLCCLRLDVNDALYCVATFLLYFQNVGNINCGLHYRLYYALYLIENSLPYCQRGNIKRVKNIPGQQSIENYSKKDDSALTYEQIRILNHRFDMNQKIRIIALAGSGKTTTLLHLARLYPSIKFLNLVFNKSVSEEAKKKFPPNVICRTAHSLAFSAVGKFLRHKLIPKIRPYDLLGLLEHKEDHLNYYTYAKYVLDTITNFTSSDAAALSLDHVPTEGINQSPISSTDRNRILLDAVKIWQKLIDQNCDLKITHDFYLKLYQLKKPKLNKFQCIMVDEAQDCNPAILDIVLSQTMPVIFVGDPYQQIYSFRKAENALHSIEATHTYHLTKSFRFGPQISYIASCVLEVMLDEKSNTLVGNTCDANLQGYRSGQYAIISRRNCTLFSEALRVVVFKQLKSYEPTIIHAAFAGGFASYGFDQILDIYRLKYADRDEKLQMRDKFVSKFKTFGDLTLYAKNADDKDLITKTEIVNTYGHNIVQFLSILKKNCNTPMELANVVFSTAHKSKGLEFDTVSLTDDFNIATVRNIPTNFDPREETDILYVAITRAKKCLLLPEKFTKVLYVAHEKFEYPVSSKALLKDGSELKCVICNSTFVPHTTLSMMRRGTCMASNRKIPEGPLCMKCGSDPYMRPDMHMNGLIMYLDRTRDNCHRFMSSIVGPLPNDPPIVYDRFSEYDNADRVFVINLNIH